MTRLFLMKIFHFVRLQRMHSQKWRLYGPKMLSKCKMDVIVINAYYAACTDKVNNS